MHASLAIANDSVVEFLRSVTANVGEVAVCRTFFGVTLGPQKWNAPAGDEDGGYAQVG